MKTPDEIKKGLEVCACGAEFGCIDRYCPYGYLEDEGECCDSVLCNDALAYIHQLEEKYERAMENVKILSDAVTKLERERDAAVEMLRRSSHCCESCKHMPISECVCTSEPKADGSCWEWRGLPEV